MAQRKHNFVTGEFYHVYNRGVDKRPIFLDDSDYQRFVSLLYVANTNKSISFKDLLRTNKNPFEITTSDHLVSIGAYCLMPNHYHILTTPLVENGLSMFMQKLSTAYSMYFNKKYQRTGALFEGKFKSQLATEDRYLKYLFSYIHLNPVKLVQSDWKEVGIKNKQSVSKYLQEYRYSSYVDMLGVQRAEAVILKREAFPDYFETIDQAEKEMHDWLNFPEVLPRV